MEARHIVRDLSFDISFASEALALEKHNDLAQFVSGRLVAVMDEVLSGVSPPDDTVVKIDRLDIDLGYLSATSYSEEAERRLRNKLGEALRRKLPEFGSDSATAVRRTHAGLASEGIVTRAQSELDIVVRFLETGYLPWNIDASRGWTMEEMLRRVMHDAGPALADRLKSAHGRDNLARRLARQFPGDLLADLAGLFVGNTVENSVPGAKRTNGWRNDWESTLLGLLDGRSAPRTEPDPDWQRLLEQAVQSGQVRYIDAFWSNLVTEWPGLIAKVVRALGMRADVRRALARDFPEPMLRDIAAILEPSEISFIEELINRPEIFQEAAQEQRESSPVRESAAVVRSNLWEFTLTYLLVERGSRFNKRIYVASVVRQMAAHQNLSYQDLLASLTDVLVRVETHSFLKQEMLWLLDELQQEETPPDAVPEDGDSLELLLGRALATGNAEPLSPYWPDLTNNQRQLVGRVVRQLGIHGNVRRAMAEGFPDPMLRDITEILEPSEIGFIEKLIGRPEVFQAAAKEHRESSLIIESAPVVKSRLWEFTLTYLLVERGSRFNRQTYVASVVRQMAAHDNLSYLDLLASLTDVVATIDTHSVLKTEMLSLLTELQHEDPAPDTASDTGDSWQALLESAMTTGHAGTVSLHWSDLALNHRRHVEEIVRRHGIHGNVRRAMARGFPEPMLRDIAEILEPSEIDVIEELLREPGPFQEEARQRGASTTELHARLWESTFTYLLRERGSAFNRRSWLGSVVHRMAAHDNLTYHELVCSLAAAGDRIHATGPLNREIHFLLADLHAEQRESESELLERALTTGNAESIAPFWKEWMLSNRQLLARTLKRCGIRADVRRFIADGFPEWMLKDIASLLASGASAFIEALLKRESDAGARRHLWEFTLTFLLSEQRGSFNRGSYVASIVRQAAVAANLRSHDCLTSMAVRMEKVSTPNAEEKELLRLLLEQADESDSPAGDRVPGVPEVIRSCELYDVVSSCLIQGERNPGWALIGAIDELMRRHPWQMLRIMREWKTGTSASSVSTWLSDAELRRLAETFVFLQSGGKPETLAAFQLRAGQVPGKRRYYLRILELLIRDLPLDFDAAETGAKTEDREVPVQLPGRSWPHEMPEELLGSALSQVGDLSAAELSRLIRTLDRLLVQPPDWLVELLRKGSAGLGKTLAGILPDRQLVRVLHLLAAPGWHRIQLLSDTVVNACLAAQVISGSAQAQRTKWQFLFKYLISENAPGSDPAFVQKFLADMAEQNGYRDSKDLGILVRRQLILDTIPPVGAARRRILEILPGTDVEGAPAPKIVRKAPLVSVPKRRKTELSADGQDIYIRNAGQVLATPYLPRLFGMAGLLEGNVFRDPDSAERAIHLLQYMVDEAVHPPEYLLTLNKILCGLAVDAPVRRDIDLTQSDKDAVDGLLGAMIAHWKALGNTSVRGLRESFLQREGRLRLKDGAWQLLVQPRAFDMLLDKLPWGLSVIRHPWMDCTVYVEWR